MTYREYATMDRLMQGITPAPVEYIAEELGGEKFKTCLLYTSDAADE